MAGLLVRAALRNALSGVRYVSPVRPRHATDLVARVYRQVERDFGMLAPPVALHSPAPGPLAASWLILRESLIAAGVVDRATKEAVAAAVSASNTCPYCVEVHNAALHGLGQDPAAEIIAWASKVGTRAGAASRHVPFDDKQGPEIIGVAVTFQYLNRMVNVFLGQSPLPPSMPGGARDTAGRMLGRIMRPSARNPLAPGDSLDLLPAAPPGDDLGWATCNPHVANAFARAGAAVEVAGRRSVPDRVRDLVQAELSTWDGQPPGPSRAWVETATAALPAPERPAGQLALLVAKASYQITEPVVDRFRATGADDAALIELTSWASLTAARRVGSWIGAGQPYSLG